MNLEVVIPLIIGGLTTFFKAFAFVHEGELGIRLRFGKAVRDKKGNPLVIHPGFLFLIPYVDTLKRHHVRQQTLRLEDQFILVKGGLNFRFSAVVLFRVTDIYKALFDIDDLDGSLVDLCKGILRDVMSELEHKDVNNLEKISGDLLQKLKTHGDEWGVTFLNFKITDCDPTAETANLINAEAAVSMKLAALKSGLKDANLQPTDFPDSLAAVLLGTPLVVSVNTSTTHTNEVEPEAEVKEGFFKKLFG